MWLMPGQYAVVVSMQRFPPEAVHVMPQLQVTLTPPFPVQVWLCVF